MRYEPCRWLLLPGMVLALMLACLGVETSGSHPMGWFLLALGVACVAIGSLCAPSANLASILRLGGAGSLGLLISGSLGVLLAGPVEHLVAADILPAWDGLETAGPVCATGGAALAGWAQAVHRKLQSAQRQTSKAIVWMHAGPYRAVRHPGYLALLLAGLGIAVGYSSIVALAILVCMVLPAIVVRVGLDEGRMIATFGDAYRSYAGRTARLVPGLW